MIYIPPPSTLPPGSSVWAYLRDSGGPTQGESIDRQRNEIQEYCNRFALALVHVFADEAKSGGSVIERDEFDKLISASAKADHPRGLLIWDFARFSRSLDDAGYFKAILRKNGLIIHSLTDAVPEGPYSRIVEMIIDVANEEKRRQVKRDTQSGLKRIVEVYGAMPGPVPTGFRKVEINAGKRRDGTPHILHRWEPDPEKAPLIREAFEMRAAGKSYRDIARATGLFSSKNSFTTFFNNTVYKGEAFFSGKTYPCPAIVSVELWEAVQRMGELRGRDRYARKDGRRLSSPYILSGLAFCQECGAPLNGYQLLGNRKYYVCSRSRRKLQRDCQGRHIPADVLESDVLRKVIEDLSASEENLQNLHDAYLALQEEKRVETPQLVLDLKKRYKALQAKIKRLVDAIGEMEDSKALLEALKTAEKEKSELEGKIAAAEKKTDQSVTRSISREDLAEEIKYRLTSGPLQERKDALGLIISRILVKRTDTQIIVAIIYKDLAKKTTSTEGSGGVSKTVSGPEEGAAEILIIPIRKYSLTEKSATISR